MEMIKITPQENGAHDNQSAIKPIPDGWALLPDDIERPETFPFVDITIKKVGGVKTVKTMTPRTVPPSPTPTPEPTPQEDTDAMLVDHELRITMLEMGV